MTDRIVAISTTGVPAGCAKMPRNGANQRLGDAVDGGGEWLLRVRAEELEREADEQQDLEDGEHERDDAARRPDRAAALWVRSRR